jgi:hypothetical protein
MADTQSVFYVAQRSLISGHTAGVNYGLDLSLKNKDRQVIVKQRRQLSLSNKEYIVHQYNAVIWNVATRPMTLTESLALREFLDSVTSSNFSFDPDNPDGASPNALRTVTMARPGYRETRSQVGPQTNDRFAFSFAMRELG